MGLRDSTCIWWCVSALVSVTACSDKGDAGNAKRDPLEGGAAGSAASMPRATGGAPTTGGSSLQGGAKASAGNQTNGGAESAAGAGGAVGTAGSGPLAGAAGGPPMGGVGGVGGLPGIAGRSGASAGGEGGRSAGGLSAGGASNGGASNGGASAGGGAGGVESCGLGDPCCAGSTCGDDLNCLGSVCSCIRSVESGYIIRTDGKLLRSISGSQTPILSGLDPIDGVEQAWDGHNHGCALKADGTVWCWATSSSNGNANGQLGNGTVTSSGTVPVSVASQVQVDPGSSSGPVYLSDIVSLSVGSLSGYGTYTTCALKGTDGSVWCWGNNTGDVINSVTDYNVPYATQILAAAASPLTGVSQVALGDRHACVLTAGLVYCWGLNVGGPLGNGTAEAEQYPVRAGVSGLDAVSKIVAGYDATCALRSGAVYCWGSSASGQIGIGDPAANTDGYPPCINYCKLNPTRVRTSESAYLDGVVDIWAGYLGMCALRDDDALWCWGSGVGDFATPMLRQSTPIENVADFALRSFDVRYVDHEGNYYEDTAARQINCGLL